MKLLRDILLNEHLKSKDFDFYIAESPYIKSLSATDYRIFIKTTYLDARKSRNECERDVINDFNKEGLGVRHHHIPTQINMAHA